MDESGSIAFFDSTDATVFTELNCRPRISKGKYLTGHNSTGTNGNFGRKPVSMT